MDWLGQTSYYETLYEEYEKTVAHISRVLSEEKVKAVILKGYGCSLHYPKPNHRPCGDIDIFVTSANGGHNSTLVEFANQVLVNAGGVDISHGNEHHSILSFEGHTIENHWTILDVNTHKSSAYLESLLEELTKETIVRHVGDTVVVLPSVRFNSIHLLRHMANDFATVKTTLRHVLDWATFVSKNDVDWDFVHKVAHVTNMNRFLDAINEICVEYLGYPEEQFPVEYIDINLRDRVLADILHPEFNGDIPPIEHKLAYNWAKTKRLWANRWKYRMVYNENLCESLYTLAKNRIKRNK